MTAAPIPSEFELELRSERNRWLRRRLLYLCIVGIVLTLFFDAPDIVRHLKASDPFHRRAGRIQAAECQLIVAIYAVTWVYARTRKLRQASLLRLVFWMVVTVALIELVGQRLALNALLAPEISPGPALSVALVSAVSGVAVLAFDHFLACLFMPWTWREALRPGGVLLGMFSLQLVADFALHHLSSAGLLMIPGLAAALVPGLLICWWRFSRFRKTFLLQFESGRYRQLQSELASARRLHEALMPPEKRDGPVRLHYAYEPMRQIGGDLLFVHPLSGGQTAISVVVLDVTGHGIPAALTVNRLVGELERLFAESPDASPSSILRSLNRYVSLTLAHHSIFATALCLHLDTTTGTLRWANGGHPPAFIRRTDGTLESLDPSAPLLGILDTEEFDADTPPATLHPGDVLFAYTDGVCEAADPDGRQLGIDGTRRLLEDVCGNGTPCKQWPRLLLDRVLSYRQSPVEDDTLVVAIYLQR
jgi:serine phosphatase RsbU (regulator of sigma subunit)